MSDAVEVGDVLELVGENDKDFDVELVDENGVPEDFSGVDAATLSLREDLATTSTVLLSRDTTQGNLVLVPTESVLRCDPPTDPELLLLPAGVYFAQVAIRKSGVWLHTDPFTVRILRSIAPEIP